MKPRNLFDDLKKIQKNKQFLSILILLFVAVIFWISGSLYRSQSRTEVSAELTKLARPLNPTIDRTIFDEVQRKKSYTDEELNNFQIYKVLTTRDGKTEVVVPINTTLDDLPSVQNNSNNLDENSENSLLQNELVNEENESTFSGEISTQSGDIN